MPVAIYNIPDAHLDLQAEPHSQGQFQQKIRKGISAHNGGVVMGRLVTLGEDGITHIFPPDPSLESALKDAANDARKAMGSTRFDTRLDIGM